MSLDYIVNKFGIDLNARSPIRLPISRHGLAQLFGELGFRHIAEIGTETGLYARALAKYNPEAKIYCIDAWQSYRGYRDHVNQAKLEGFYEKAKERLAPYNVHIVRKFSMDAVKDFRNETLDALYIDANHEFQAFTNDLCEWSKKVKKGGIVSGHDFERHKGKSYIHVKEVIEGYTQAYKITPWFTTNDDGDFDDTGAHSTARSWMWVKQ